jgi:hypothetical protein
MSLAIILVLYASGISIHALSPVPAFATDDNNYYNTNDNTNDKTNDNNYDVMLFLIDVVECFTNNNEEFSDDVQLCLYDVIDEYFDNDDDNNNNLNNNNDSQDSNDISSNDDDNNNNNNNNGTSSQET